MKYILIIAMAVMLGTELAETAVDSFQHRSVKADEQTAKASATSADMERSPMNYYVGNIKKAALGE